MADAPERSVDAPADDAEPTGAPTEEAASSAVSARDAAPTEASADAPSPADQIELVVVGYDAWTEPVLVELERLGASVTVITTDGDAADAVRERGADVVRTADVDEACFREAGVDQADAVLVATLDDRLNVLAVLTVMNVDPSMEVVTFAGEGRDVPKLRAAGADRVVSLGETIGELLVEVALAEQDVQAVVDDLVSELG